MPLYDIDIACFKIWVEHSRVGHYFHCEIAEQSLLRFWTFSLLFLNLRWIHPSLFKFCGQITFEYFYLHNNCLLGKQRLASTINKALRERSLMLLSRVDRALCAIHFAWLSQLVPSWPSTSNQSWSWHSHWACHTLDANQMWKTRRCLSWGRRHGGRADTHPSHLSLYLSILFFWVSKHCLGNLIYSVLPEFDHHDLRSNPLYSYLAAGCT